MIDRREMVKLVVVGVVGVVVAGSGVAGQTGAGGGKRADALLD